MFTFAEVNQFVRPSPPLVGFESCAFEFRLLTIDNALDHFTCWAAATRISAFVLTTQNPKVLALAANFPSSSVSVIAFERATLARIWPSAYAGQTGTQLVVLEGNHRLCALAVRRAAGINDDFLVGFFIGR